MKYYCCKYKLSKIENKKLMGGGSKDKGVPSPPAEDDTTWTSRRARTIVDWNIH